MLDAIRNISHTYLKDKHLPYRRTIIDDPDFMNHRMAILAGGRGVGKTTLIIQKLLEYAEDGYLSCDILYVPSDHFLVGEHSLYEIAEQFVQYGGRYIAFDEIHKYPNWSQELKSIFDTFSDLQIMVSGSSLLDIHQGSHDLARRCAVYHLEGLSFREYLGLFHGIHCNKISLHDLLNDPMRLSHSIVDILAQQQQKILPLFKSYLKRGYYPYYLEIKNDATYKLTLNQNLTATLETDIPAIHPSLTSASIRKIKQVLAFISQQVPFKPNYNKMKDAIGISDTRTLKTYLKYLEDAEIIQQLRKSTNKFNAIETPEKIYLHNPNQYYALTDTPNIGTVRELFLLRSIQGMHTITAPKSGDFLIDEQYTVEVGGRDKTQSQIKHTSKAYLACDDIETGQDQRIPLWLWGFIK